jgi:2-keto-3-deoxy-6-phosphogluconate aldolase
MPKYIVTNPKVTINGTNVSPSIAAATLELTSTDVDVTSFGSNGWTEIIGGLKSGTVSLDFHSGYAAGEINTVLNPLVGTIATVVINPNGTVTSSTNPAWTATVHVNSVSPVAGAVGDLATFTVSYPTSGSVTFATA